MAKFTTRVELHKANSDDYDTLHEEMENEGFTRTITDTDTNEEFHLPEAEYNYEGNTTKGDVLDKAKKAADNTGRKYSILVTKSNGRIFSNLDPA